MRASSRSRVTRSPRRGQSLVEYMLALSVLSVGIAAGYIMLSESTREAFKNTRETVQRAWP